MLKAESQQDMVCGSTMCKSILSIVVVFKKNRWWTTQRFDQYVLITLGISIKAMVAARMCIIIQIRCEQQNPSYIKVLNKTNLSGI